MLITWATWLTWGTGPWRVLPRFALLLGNSLGVAAAVVVLTAPTGWAGRDEAASYAVVGQVFLVLAAWASDDIRRWALLGALVAFGVLQFTKGWLQWWGGGDPAQPFVGTFYWHNQSGICLAVASVLAALLVVARRRPWAHLGWVAAPICAAGTLFSTSRASQLVVVLGISLLALWAVVVRSARAWWPRLAALGALSFVTSVVLVGPPFFAGTGDGPKTPFAGTAARGAQQPLSGNTSYRLETWEHAVLVFREFPVTGTGFGGFKSAATLVTGEPQRVHHSHNAFLQAAADGGLVLAVPLWVAAAALSVVVLRRVCVSRGLLPLPLAGGALALLLLVLHSGMDFDWSYPALFVAAAVAAAAAWQPGPASAGGRARLIAAACGTALIVGAVLAAWGGGMDLNTRLDGTL
jgi:O-antigen ligase